VLSSVGQGFSRIKGRRTAMQVICRQHGKTATAVTPSLLACERRLEISRLDAEEPEDAEDGLKPPWLSNGAELASEGVKIIPGARATGLALMLACHAHARDRPTLMLPVADGKYAPRLPPLCRWCPAIDFSPGSPSRQTTTLGVAQPPQMPTKLERAPSARQSGQASATAKDVRTSCWP
jgi:hypothetical protein